MVLIVVLFAMCPHMLGLESVTEGVQFCDTSFCFGCGCAVDSYKPCTLSGVFQTLLAHAFSMAFNFINVGLFCVVITCPFS